MPPAMVVRLATWVRFGPVTPTVVGLPLMVWQPAHPPPNPATNARPRSASPLSDSLNSMPAGIGVLGTTCAGIRSRGKATKPACCTAAPVIAPMSCGTVTCGASGALRGRAGAPPTGFAGGVLPGIGTPLCALVASAADCGGTPGPPGEGAGAAPAAPALAAPAAGGAAAPNAAGDA